MEHAAAALLLGCAAAAVVMPSPGSRGCTAAGG
jgi:hypothetical protein